MIVYSMSDPILISAIDKYLGLFCIAQKMESNFFVVLYTMFFSQSLQSLGLTHVLNMYLTGVGVTSPQSMQGLSRFQYEAAWRCAIWDDQNIRFNSVCDYGS